MDTTTGSLHLRLLDGDVVVENADEQSAAAWSRCRVDDPPVPSTTLLSLTDDEGGAVRGIAADRLLTDWALEQAAGRNVLLHACGLASDDGSVVALVGRSGAGKTTAAATLGLRFGYVSDEVVAVTTEGTVVPFPRSLGVMAPEGPGRKASTGPDHLGLRVPPDDLRLHRLVVLDRAASHDSSAMTPSTEPLPLAEALVSVIPQVSYLGRLDRPLCRLAAAVALTGPVHLRYGEIADTSDVVAALLAEVPEPLDWAPEPSDRSDATNWALSDGRIRRRPWIDAIRADDRLVVLLGLTPVVIDGIGPTIWSAAAHAPTLDEVVAAVVDLHGANPDASALVTAAVEALVEAGVLSFERPRTVTATRAAFVASCATDAARYRESDDHG